MSQIPKPEKFKDFSEPDAFRVWMKGAIIFAAVACVVALVFCLVAERCGKRGSAETQGPQVAEKKSPAPPPDLHNPVREAPASFPPDSNLPRGKEIYASGAIDLKHFNATNDLVRFEDQRVWFESDHDTGDDEDDHMIHRAVEVPLKRLANLMEKRGTLKIHEAFRAAEKNKIHIVTSLHCEGRAVDLTSETMTLTELAKLAWQAGFDFVLYEKPKQAGVHLHCSVKSRPDAPLPSRSAK
ncbi:MAG: hypothetical protein WCK89_01375 [bacterium]